jgi:NTP pyrophosphatase (non-canonical NTP hydrolase)
MEERIINAINEAMRRQKEKFGGEPLATPSQFAHILGEEFGEVCRAINQGNREQLQHETIQCIAVIAAYLQNDLHYGMQE